jgi:hypothetical protein
MSNDVLRCRYQKTFRLALAIAFVILGAGCATHEKQAAGPPLMQAERRLARAEKATSNIEGQAAEYLAVAKNGYSQVGGGSHRSQYRPQEVSPADEY